METVVRPVPKPRREVDPRWIAYVKTWYSWECLVHGAGCRAQFGEPDPCHVKTRGSGGSDRYIIPLCRPEHRKFDTEVEWLYRHKAAFAEWIWNLADLYREYRKEFPE